jgi:hypothetical protein
LHEATRDQVAQRAAATTIPIQGGSDADCSRRVPRAA